MNSFGRLLMGGADERLDPRKPIGYRLYQEHISRYVFASSFTWGKRALDLGSGTGYGAAYLAGRGCRDIVGGDIAADAIRYARQRYPQVSYLRLDAMHLPFHNATFDVALCFEVIEHVLEPLALLQECHRVLRDGSTFVCSTPNRDSRFALAGSPYHIREFSVEELLKALREACFENVTLYGQRFLDPSSMGRNKIRSLIWDVGGGVLSYWPWAKERLVPHIAKWVIRDSRRISFRDDLNFEADVDPFHSVVPWCQRAGQIPTTIVAVATVRKIRDVG